MSDKGGPTRARRAAVTFKNHGKVSGVSMSPPFAGTPAEAALLSAFADFSFTVDSQAKSTSRSSF